MCALQGASDTIGTYFRALEWFMFISVAERSTARICVRLLAGTAGSNSAEGKDGCFLWVYGGKRETADNVTHASCVLDKKRLHARKHTPAPLHPHPPTHTHERTSMHAPTRAHTLTKTCNTCWFTAVAVVLWTVLMLRYTHIFPFVSFCSQPPGSVAITCL